MALPVPAGPGSNSPQPLLGQGESRRRRRGRAAVAPFPLDPTTRNFQERGRLWRSSTGPAWKGEARGGSGFQFPGIRGMQYYGTSAGILV